MDIIALPNEVLKTNVPISVVSLNSIHARYTVIASKVKTMTFNIWNGKVVKD